MRSKTNNLICTHLSPTVMCVFFILYFISMNWKIERYVFRRCFVYILFFFCRKQKSIPILPLRRSDVLQHLKWNKNINQNKTEQKKKHIIRILKTNHNVCSMILRSLYHLFFCFSSTQISRFKKNASSNHKRERKKNTKILQTGKVFCLVYFILTHFGEMVEVRLKFIQII